MPSTKKERFEYRVAWRRAGNVAEQTRIIGLKPTAEKLYRELLSEQRDDEQGLNLVIAIRLERRKVSHWETLYRQEAPAS